MAKFRTTKQRIEDELNRSNVNASIGRIPALRTTLQNVTPITTTKVVSVEPSKKINNEVADNLGLIQNEKKYGSRQAELSARVSDETARERTRRGVETREDLFRQEYNETPNYNLIERIFDKSKSESYADKSRKTERYQTAVTDKLDKIMADYQKNGGDVSMLAGADANELLHPFQYEQARKDIEPLLKANGITFEELEDYYGKQAMAQQNKDMAEYAKEHPFGAFGTEIVANQISGLQGAVSGLSNYLTGKPLNSNQAATEYGKLSPTIHETVKEGIGNPVGQTLYDVETAVANNLFSLALGGGNQAAVLGLMGTNAGGNALNAEMDKNTDPWQKVATAASSGAIEVLTEKLPLDNLLKIVKNPAGKQTAKQLVMNILKQGGEEFLGEGIGEVADNFVDYVINRGESDYSQNVKAYETQGMTENQARTTAKLDVTKSALYSAIVGALSGMAMSGGGSALNNALVNAENKSKIAGLRMDANSDARAYERAKQGQLNAELAKLKATAYDYNQSAEGDFNAQQNAQLSQMLEQARQNDARIKALNDAETSRQGRFAEEQNAPGTIDSLNRQLSEAMAQMQAEKQARIDEIRRTPLTDSETGIETFLEVLNDTQNQSTEGKRSPRNKRQDNLTIKKLTEQHKKFMERYQQTNDPTAKGLADAIQLQLDSMQERIYEQNATEKVLGDGLEDLNRDLKDVVNKFGTDETKRLYKQLNKALSDYVRTNDMGAMNRANEIIAQMDKSMEGRQFKYNLGGTYTYSPDMIWDVFGNNMDALGSAIKKNVSSNVPTTETSVPTAETEEQAEISKPGLTQEQRDVIPQQEEQKAQETAEKPKRSKVMAEDAGLGKNANSNAGKTRTESNLTETIRQNSNGAETLTVNPYEDEPNSTQTSRNSMIRYFDDMPEVQELIKEQRKLGLFDKDVHTNEETLNKAENALNRDEEGEKQRLLNAQHIDEVDTAEGLLLARRMFNDGDYDGGSQILQSLSKNVSTPARVLQMLGSLAGTGEGTIVKANSLIKDEITNWEKSNKKAAKGCSKLAQVLKNIGNDYTERQLAPRKNFEQIREGVEHELSKESSSVFDSFNDTDIDLLARMVENGEKAEFIQLKLEQRLATGSWDISAEDINKVLDLFQKAADAGINSKEAVDLRTEAYKTLSKYLPPVDFKTKLTHWRMLSMLGNLKTIGRNKISNTVFGKGVTAMADEIAGILEASVDAGAKATTGEGIERTKTALPKNKKLVDACLKYGLENAYAPLTDSVQKYKDTKRDIASQQKVFRLKGLEWARNKVTDTLENDDTKALLWKYKRAMAGYLQANGKDASVFDSTNPKDTILVDRASEYAIRRAKEATFHEDNVLASLLSKWSSDAKNKGGLAGNAAYVGIESLVPFKKTTMNIAKQGYKYSPANAISMVKAAINKNPTLFIEEASKALTGSALLQLGYLLAAKGLLRATGDEDEDETLAKTTGKQNYSMKVKDYWVTLDWVAPASLPLFVGSRIYEKTHSDKQSDWKDNVLDALTAIEEPMTEMTLLQGVNNMLEELKYDKKSGNSSPLRTILTSMATGYAGQYIPTLVNQTAKTVDDTKRSTYSGSDSFGGKLLQNAIYNKNKIPFLSKTSEPSLNIWGEEKKQNGNNVIDRALQNYILPAYITKEEENDVEKELNRLSGLMSDGTIEKQNIIPSTPNKKYDKQQLSPKEYTQFSKILGQDELNIMGETIDNPRYEQLDDESKAVLLSDMLLFSKALAKNEMFGYDIEGSNTYKKKYEAYQRGGVDGLIDFITLKDNLDGKTSDSATIETLENMDGLTDADKAYYFKSGKKEYSKEAQYLERINEKYAYDWYKIKNESGSSKDDMIYGIYTSGLPEEEKQALLEVLNMTKDELTYELTVGK